jgi:hypothetical protein
MKRVCLLMLMVVSVAAPSQTAPPQPNIWNQEPTSFFGIKLGEPIRASMPECPKVTEYGSTRYDWVSFRQPCFEVLPSFYEVDNAPKPFFHVFVQEVGGKVEAISAKFNNGNSANLSGIDASGVASALIAKFGPPFKSGKETVHNNAGAAFENDTLEWSGPNAHIEFESVAGEYNHGLISVYTAAFAANSNKDEGQQKKAIEDSF